VPYDRAFGDIQPNMDEKRCSLSENMCKVTRVHRNCLFMSGGGVRRNIDLEERCLHGLGGARHKRVGERDANELPG
jgi:hypothetical protein